MRIFFLLAAICAVQGHSSEAQKSVIVSLNARWQSTSLVAESSEYVAKEDDDHFWSFVKGVAEKAKTSDWNTLTSEDKYDLAVKQTAATLGDTSIDLLKLSLSLRAFSPVVQLFQQIGSEYSSDCAAFFDVHGTVGCCADELTSAVESASKNLPVSLLSVDHIYPSANISKVTIVIYGDIGSPELSPLHEKAVSLSRQHGLLYALRHYQKNPKGSTSLSGYGVELAIKNTEYKAEDDSNKKNHKEQEDEENLHGFNFKLLKQLHQDSKESLDALRMHLKDIEELTPLKQWQVQDLSFQAAQKIVNDEAENAIGLLKELSQNFPLHARSISRERVDSSLRQEIDNNQKNAFADIGLEAGETALYLNGINLDIDNLDMFELLDTLKQEEKLANGFYSMGIMREYLSILVGLDLSDEKVNYAVDYRDAYPFYVNNLDSDKKYKQWGNSVKLMLQPYYPGMIRPIARNLFNLIFVVDPADADSRNLMKIALSFYQHEIPLRIGFIFAVNPDRKVSGKEDVGVAILNLFNYLSVDSTVQEALRTVNKVLDNFRTRAKITPEDIKQWFVQNNGDADYDEVFGPESDYDKGRTTGAEFLARTAIGKAPRVLLNGYVLDEAGIKGDKFEEAVMMEVMKITPKIQRAVMHGQLTDRANVGNWLLDQKEVMPRLNARVLDAPVAKKYVNLENVSPCEAKTLTQFLPLSGEEKSQCVVEKTKYFKRNDEDVTLASTLWVVADVESAKGRELVYNSIKHLKHSKTSRVGILLNPVDEGKACDTNSISSFIHAAIRLLPHQQAKQLVTKLVKEEFASKLAAGSVSIEELAVGGMNVEHFKKEKKLLNCDKIKMEAKFAEEVLSLRGGQSVVIANGLIIGPLDNGEMLQEADFVLMEKMLATRGSTVIASHVDKWEIEKENGHSSNIVLRAASLIGRHAAPKKRTWVVLSSDEHSSITLVADQLNRAAMDVVAVVDPLSASAQKLAPVLELLRDSVNCDVKIVVNPKPKLSELPLKRFFRYVASSQPQFDGNGEIIPNSAIFTGLPSKQLLTLALHAPDAWMVENVHAEYDLDNIKMAQVSTDVIALFSLEHILLEGHCFDEVSGSPPRGLQFVLGTSTNPTKYDTIVMANLGYFQLKANPGAWQLRLREGKSKEIYQVTGHTNTEAEKDEAISVLIDSFSGRTIRVRVSKKEGMEEKNLLSDENEGGSIWNSIVGETHETINVFSLASGHLYERFMRIMILSVMKNTKHPVKFWLLKNYLSPQFKESLPILAKEYGFEYALVEYKWPRWLHQQKEKQRVMWGYKILFLDVLFPLDVQKIIFVDADQIVRADLMELMEFDLGGAPYGYVPFCDSRKEMDGFRFWKQGYWANHLAGRRYHISALYVIDLQKFRQIAAGDRLRGQYQGLSSDPNSLANLDQDLPNNMIHQVKIKSLPQEWLWCETWCDDASKKSAKTIDLCNNPLTKEPKLDSASRIVSEWNAYDQEIKKVLAGVHPETHQDKHVEL